MKDNKSRYTLRMDAQQLEKLQYIAEYEGRTKNGQLVYMVNRLIEEFEEKHGPIETKE